MRGEPRVKAESDLTTDDIGLSNLVLWGDPSTSPLFEKVAATLPVQWSAETIGAGSQSFPAKNHVLIAIYPNALAPNHYVVLNSGFTWREYDDLNNARQGPRLPDWAVIDLDTPPSPRYPGRIASAGFFGEEWEFVEPPK